MYSKIQNPQTGRMVSIHGVLGKDILRKYLGVLLGGGLVGGGLVGGPDPQKVLNDEDSPDEVIFVVAEWCGHCIRAGDTFKEAMKLIRANRNETIDSEIPTVFCLENSEDQESWNLEPKMGQDFKDGLIEGFKTNASGFPTIIKRSKGQYEVYGGEREVSAIVGWAK